MSPEATEVLELHGERAAQRGNPSMVWRAGQNRRLDMMLRWGRRYGRDSLARDTPGRDSLGRVLVDGCGVGMYVRALLPHSTSVDGIDIEAEHLDLAAANVPDGRYALALGEQLPYGDGEFDYVLSHEVLEHVYDDALAAAEMVRVLAPGGRAIVFAPNRLYPFETHGHYWRGRYHFGNTPLINYLPDALRTRLAPHVRSYTRDGLLSLFLGQPVRVKHFSQIYPGYDNLVYRRPALGRLLRRITYALEASPLTAFGISHMLVLEKIA